MPGSHILYSVHAVGNVPHAPAAHAQVTEVPACVHTEYAPQPPLFVRHLLIAVQDFPSLVADVNPTKQEHTTIVGMVAVHNELAPQPPLFVRQGLGMGLQEYVAPLLTHVYRVRSHGFDKHGFAARRDE